MKKRGSVKAILLVVIVILILIAIYFTFFFSYTCKDLSCFRAHQEKCSRTKFTNYVEDATWKYSIAGKSKGECKINVKLAELKKGEINFKEFEGKSMNCYLPKGSIAAPESDLSKCHGELKEALQETIINKLHAYIINNLGEINEELRKAI